MRCTRFQSALARPGQIRIYGLKRWIKPADTTVGDKGGTVVGGRNAVGFSKDAGAKAQFQNGTTLNPGAIPWEKGLTVSGCGSASFGPDCEHVRQGGYPPCKATDEYARIARVFRAEGIDRMAQKRPNARPKQARDEPCARFPKMELISIPTHMNPVSDESLQAMHPGDVIILDDYDSLRPLVESVFFAVLSCPGCGTLGLITIRQYCGLALVICGSDFCSCQFRIVEKSRFQYLPAS